VRGREAAERSITGQNAAPLCYGYVMNTEPKQTEDFVVFYRRAFKIYGCRALWNVRELETPSLEDALAITRSLRVEGDLNARRLAEQIEKACHAAV
jgi:hypothetical protein